MKISLERKCEEIHHLNWLLIQLRHSSEELKSGYRKDIEMMKSWFYQRNIRITYFEGDFCLIVSDEEINDLLHRIIVKETEYKQILMAVVVSSNMAIKEISSPETVLRNILEATRKFEEIGKLKRMLRTMKSAE